MDNNFKFKGKFLAFDFDGTLADSLALYLDIYNDFAKEKGYRIATLQDIEELRNNMSSLNFLIRFSGKFGINPLQFPFFVKHMFSRIRLKSKDCQIFPGIPELLSDLHKEGYVLNLVTSNQEPIVTDILKSQHLEQFFTGVYALDFLGDKGNKLKEMLTELRINADQFLYIGDEVRDIKAARKAGIQVISVGWGLNSTQLLAKNRPDAIAKNLAELRQLLSIAYLT